MPERKNINIGIDFGASSTKVAYSDMSQGVGRVVRILRVGNYVDSYPYTATPSVVAIENGKLFFGDLAARCNPSMIHRSLKVQLANPDMSRVGISVIRGSSLPDEMAFALSVLFIAFILRECEAQLSAYYRDFDVRYAMNLGAPLRDLDGPQDQELKCTYRRVMACAWLLAHQASHHLLQGMTIEEADTILEPLARLDHREMEEQVSEYTHVVPECHAAIMGVFGTGSPSDAVRYFLTIDIGASTTDIALFNIGDAGNYIASYFATHVAHAGMLDVEPFKGTKEWNDALRKLGREKIRKGVISTFNDAYGNDRLHKNRHHELDGMSVWFIGGGSRNRVVVDTVTVKDEFLPGIRWELRRFRQPGTAPCHQDLDPDLAARDLDFSLVALGLAVDYNNLVKYVVPSDVPPVHYPPPPERFIQWDLY